MMRSKVVLPHPLGPSSEKNSPSLDRERHAIQGKRSAAIEGFGYTPDLHGDRIADHGYRSLFAHGSRLRDGIQ